MSPTVTIVRPFNTASGVAQRYNDTLKFDSLVNSTTFGPRETNSYTSLVQLDSTTAMVTYDLHRMLTHSSGVEASFSMVINVGST